MIHPPAGKFNLLFSVIFSDDIPGRRLGRKVAHRVSQILQKILAVDENVHYRHTFYVKSKSNQVNNGEGEAAILFAASQLFNVSGKRDRIDAAIFRRFARHFDKNFCLD